MCGICGIYAPAAAQAAGLSSVRQMTHMLRHRGPDGLGFWSDGHVQLGHARLAIIDVDGGHQPMLSSEGNVAMVFNGEIYNYRELRVVLAARGWQFRTNSDSEVVLVAYQEYGEKFVELLDGMFAIAIWDAGLKRLLLVRDRMGEKPLYYRDVAGGAVAFGSEPKVLLRLIDNKAPSINREVLGEYLCYRNVGGGDTLFEGVRELAAGTIRSYSSSGVETRRYWTPSVPEQRTDVSLATISEVLYRATAARLVSDVPLGAIVSGGIDSSLITAMAVRAKSAPLDTFCVGFDDPDLDERKFAARMAEYCGTRHHDFVMSDSDFAAQLLPLTWANDAPLTHPNAVPMHMVFRYAREVAGVKVVLSGEGADELFGGYSWYASVARAQRLRSMAAPALIAWMLPPMGRIRTLRRILRGDYPLESNGVTSAENWGDLGITAEGIRPWRRSAFERKGERASIESLYLYDQLTYLPPLLQRQDRMSMAAGVEARVVFLDHHLVELANSMRDSQKRPHGVRKGFLRALAAEWIPDDLLARPKVGFVLPLAKWLSKGGALFQMRDFLGSSDSISSTIASPRSLARLRDAKLDENPWVADAMWSLLALDIWAHVFLRPEAIEYPLAGSALYDQSVGSIAHPIPSL
jgi:asparagine synthase (glutamine-hydrolysing)